MRHDYRTQKLLSSGMNIFYDYSNRETLAQNKFYGPRLIGLQFAAIKQYWTILELVRWYQHDNVSSSLLIINARQI
jgi:hypothetical protein